MLDLRRLRLLYELRERGTIAAVADALQFTPSAVSQQLAVLERDAGLPLLERAGRTVRLTDAALVLAEHAAALLDRAARAESDLAAARGTVGGRARVAAFQSVARRLAAPALLRLVREAPGLRCELIEAEPEDAIPALALGDVDLVLADEWQHQPHAPHDGVERHNLYYDPVRVVLAADHPLAARYPGPIPFAQLRGAAWATGHPGTGWEALIQRTGRQLGGFEPDIRHRANDSVIALELVAHGLAVTLLRDIAEGPIHRTIYAATRTADRTRPSVQALLRAVRGAAADRGWDEFVQRNL
jgi:DNA-binding transcriptional LysR family regulator